MLQNYFDHEPGSGARDYACGLLTYDGHDGTDIRLPNLAAMLRGVPVIAAADGTVRATRDGMDDLSVREIGVDRIKGREAGNSVAVVHGSGWETQYSHLQRGSVRVKTGDTIRRGHVLGLVGLSGRTEFPHLHFSVRYKGAAIDPFVGTGEHKTCGAGLNPLWDPETLATLHYVPTGVLDAGFAGEVPTFRQIKAGAVAPPGGSARTLVFWVNTYGMQAGDREHVRILAPDGKLFTESRRTLPAKKAEWFTYTGRKRRDASWPAGTYSGEYTLLRDTSAGPRKVVSIQREIRIAP